MAIKKPRKQTKKPAPAAASAHAGGSSLAMPEMLPHGPGAGASHIQPPTPLPPGVYFSPTKEECLRFLNRSIAGDSALPGARGYIFHANVYGEGHDVLCQRHPRTRQHVVVPGPDRGEQERRPPRQDRRVLALRDEQEETLDDGAGFKSRFGFYTGPTKKDRSPWLMQEFTSAKDDGAGKRAAPALYRVYVTHATDDELRGIYGEDGVKIGPDGEKKPDRAVVPEEYFDAIGKLLPRGSVRCGVGQEHVALPQSPPPPPPLLVAPTGFPDCYGQQGQYLGQYHQQQHEQWAAPGVDIFGQQFFGIAPLLLPPASPGLLSKVTAYTPLDNLSMSMAEFMGMFNEQPAETGKEGEPNWESLGNIVDDDEFASFNSTWCLTER